MAPGSGCHNFKKAIADDATAELVCKDSHYAYTFSAG